MTTTKHTLWSWNINGLRAAVRKGFLDWLRDCDGHIVALQEVRALPGQLSLAVRAPRDWWTHFAPAERKGYSGVGMYARVPGDEVETSLGIEAFDVEGRVQMVRFGALRVVNVYFPNGSGRNRDHSRVPYKLAFYRRLFDALNEGMQRGERILVVGDYNTAHEPIDLARPRQNKKTSGFLDEERAELSRWLDAGWVDTFRAHHPDTARYSWWSSRGNVRERNIGWRIDYVLASPGAWPYVTDAMIETEVMVSDQCHVGVCLDTATYDEASDD